MLEQTTLTQNVGTKQRMVANNGHLLKQLSWWVFFLISAVFGAYALYMGGLEILARLGIAENAPERAVPYAFIIHALTGGMALIVGPVQFNRNLLVKKRTLHRTLGRVYVGSILTASVTGLWSAIFFDRGVAARIVFSLVAILWFGTTLMGYLRARSHQFKEHREWMIRSFALSLFFVTFPFWVEGLTNTNLPEAVSYPLGVFLGWSVNLMVAELWIHLNRSRVTGFLHMVSRSFETNKGIETRI